MYRIEHLPALQAAPIGMWSMHARGAIDEERGLIVRHIGRYRETECTAWLLQHGDALVPFDVGERFTSEGGRPTLVLTLQTFGSSSKVAQRTGIGAYTFEGAEQKSEWELLAAEGVLVTEAFRARTRDQSLRIEVSGRNLTIEGLGYSEEA
jgi:hypothetical protein